MRNLKKYIFIGMTALLATSCSDFLDTAPKDALSPVSTWQTQEDADKFLVGCYNNWQDQYNSGWGWDGFLLYWDGTSDFGYDQFPWEGYTAIGNGTLTASSGRDWYASAVSTNCWLMWISVTCQKLPRRISRLRLAGSALTATS